MIELIILDGKTFTIKDYTFTNEYNIIFDSLVQNTSTFKISKLTLNAKNNDILITRNFIKQYIGIIDNIKITNGISDITCYHFSRKFDIPFIASPTENTNLGAYIKNMISNKLITSNDTHQNINYLEIENKSFIAGTISLEDNSIQNILNVITNIMKTYELILDYQLTYYSTGVIKGIKLVIKDVNKQLRIKSSEKFIQNVNVVDGSIGKVNKILFVPDENNVTYTQSKEYYLLSEGLIGVGDLGKNNPLRILPVVLSIEKYKDNEIESDIEVTLLSKAKEKFTHTQYNHYISFTLNNNNAISVNSLSLGDRIIFNDIENNKEYTTIITQLNYTNSSNLVKLQLGLNRISLTDKLMLRR